MFYCKHFFVWYFDSEKLILLFQVFSVKKMRFYYSRIFQFNLLLHFDLFIIH